MKVSSRRSCFAIVALVQMLGSCNDPRSTDPRIELTLWKHQAGNTEEAATAAAITRFNASQQRWVVKAQSLPQGAYSQSIVAGSLAGRLPCILTVDSPKVASFVWAGHIRPLDGLIPPTLFTDVSHAAVGRYGDHVYAVGQFDAALAIFTRRSTLERLNMRIPTLDAPWTRAEFDGLLAKAKASGEFRYPLDLSTRDTKADWWTYGFSPMLQSFGGDLIDRSTMRSAQGVLNGENGQRFAIWFQRLFASGYVNRKEPDENAFVKGRAALSYTGNWWAPDYRRQIGSDLLILPPPDFGHGTVIGGGSWQWAISSTCPHSEGAATLIRFLMTPGEIAAMADAAGMVPVTEAAAARSVQFRKGGEGRVFFDLMQRFARPRPATPAFAVVSNSFFLAMRNVMDGKDVRDALDDAVDEVDTTIADNRSYNIRHQSVAAR